MTTTTAPANLKILIPRDQISARIGEMGAEITRDYAGQNILLVGVLKGACIFLSDLARQITLDATFDFIAVSSYGAQKQTSGEVKLVKDVDKPLSGKHVILVEDILDTGYTLTYLRRLFEAAQPKSLKIATLLDKPSRRLKPITADYCGFQIPDEFVVGYGLDFAEKYRNLPDICVVEGGHE